MLKLPSVLDHNVWFLPFVAEFCKLKVAAFEFFIATPDSVADILFAVAPPIKRKSPSVNF